MRFSRAKTLSIILPVLQIITGVLTGFASNYGWSAWWICAVPWAVLNFAGIVLAIPVVTAVFIVAGVAGVDWRNEAFFIGWFIAAPTVLSLIACQIWTLRRRKRTALPRAGL